MPATFIVGVMGPGTHASSEVLDKAFQLGKFIASEGWITLSGGRKAGVMDAVSRGAKENGGLTIGILPDTRLHAVSDYIDISIITDMGSARNNINVLTAHVVVACGVGAGTLSEVALALKAQKPIILLDYPPEGIQFLQMIDTQRHIHIASSVEETINLIQEILKIRI